MESTTPKGSLVIASAAEIAVRLQKATQSGVASSCFASYSHSPASSTGRDPSHPPTAEDLLPTLGPPDAATDFGEAEEDLFSDPEVEYITTKSASSLVSFPLPEVGAQKVLPSPDISSDEGKSSLQPEPLKANAQTPLPGCSEQGSKPSAEPPTGLANADGEEKRPSVLEYSTKLEGVSLEDFFSNEVKAQVPLASNSDTIADSFFEGAIIGETSGISVHKSSLFWDPLSESIIPDGFDLMGNSSETCTAKVGSSYNLFGVEDNDDPFSSWEGDFQSAAPAMTNVSNASSSHIPRSQLSALPMTRIKDVFGDCPSVSSGGGESSGIQGNNSWVSNGDLFDLNLDAEKTPGTDFEENTTDVEDSFGSGWQQSLPRATRSAANDSQSMSQSLSFSDTQSVLVKSNQVLLGMKETDTFTVNNSLDFGREATSTENLGPGWSASAVNKNKAVGSLLAQLHDLSFLLSDKLVIRS